jgi:uncharacterized protein YukE
MTRQLVILGTSVTLPDPASAADLAASFQELSGHLAGLETTLQALTRPDAWGVWTGLAADEFGRSIGQLPAELGDVREAYGDVASALRQYAGQLEPAVSSLVSLSFRAEDAEGTLAAVRRARSQAIASGHDPVTTGWDARLADANAAVSGLRGQLNRLLGELTALAAACTKKITAAEPRTARKSLFGSLESEFVRDVADPLARAVRTLGLGAEAVARVDLGLAADVFKLDEFIVVGAWDVFDTLVVHPIAALPHDIGTYASHMTAENLGHMLGDVAGVLGILALIPGVDAVAVPALVLVSGVAAVADWVAVAHHEKGASVLQASLATLTCGLGGVSFVASKAVDADSGLFQQALNSHDLGAMQDLKNGDDAAASGKALWATGLRKAISPSDIKASIARNYQYARDPLGQGDAPAGLRGFGRAVSSNVGGVKAETLNGGFDDLSHSPAAVTIEQVKWGADQLNSFTGVVQDRADKLAESPAS